MSLRARLLAVARLAHRDRPDRGRHRHLPPLRSFLVERVDRTAQGTAERLRTRSNTGGLRPRRPRRDRDGQSGRLHRRVDSAGTVNWAAIGMRPGDAAAAAEPAGRVRDGGSGRTDPFTVQAVNGDTRFRVQLRADRGRPDAHRRRAARRGRRHAPPAADRRAGGRRLGARRDPPPRPLARPRRPASARPNRADGCRDRRRRPLRSASRTTIRAPRSAGSAGR